MKIYTYLAILIFVSLSLIPPIDVVITNPQNQYWLWMICIAGFLGVYTLFIKTSLIVKIIAVAGFISCFFSVAPYVSFTAYVSVIACCYFYIVCSKIEDWNLIYKIMASVALLQVLVLTMQFFNKDPLFNFGLIHREHYGTIGHRMQMGSLSVIMSALLVCFNKFFILFPIFCSVMCNSTWTFLSAGVGIAVYLFQRSANTAAFMMILIGVLFCGWAIRDHKIMENIDSNTGRTIVWQKSIELSNQRPWVGWGIATFKDIFHPLSKMTCFPWRTAHNFIVQLIFEVGYPLTGCLLFALGYLFWTLLKAELWSLLAGLSMIIFDAMVHFPDRMIETVPLMIIFLAYCHFCVKRFRPIED